MADLSPVFFSLYMKDGPQLPATPRWLSTRMIWPSLPHPASLCCSSTTWRPTEQAQAVDTVLEDCHCLKEQHGALHWDCETHSKATTSTAVSGALLLIDKGSVHHKLCTTLSAAHPSYHGPCVTPGGQLPRPTSGCCRSFFTSHVMYQVWLNTSTLNGVIGLCCQLCHITTKMEVPLIPHTKQ